MSIVNGSNVRLVDDARYAALVAALGKEFPRFRIVAKRDSSLHRAIHVALVALTFGRMRSYLDSYQTTIGSTVYVTDEWPTWPADRRYVVLRHEAVHLRQFRRWTLPGMALLYLLVPLPAGLAWCRARFEQEAYAESIRAAAEVWGAGHPRRAEFREHIIGQFLGPSYGWMWPFRAGLERWYDAILASLPASE
jgi:hypothetical protein